MVDNFELAVLINWAIVLNQEIATEKLKLEHVQTVEESSGLRVQNQKLSEEASYAKELASAAAVELKNLAGEVTKLSLQNAKLEKDLQAARELSSRSSSLPPGSSGNRRNNDIQRAGRRGRAPSRSNDAFGMSNDEFDSWNLDPDDMRLELQARKQREASLESALAEKEILEDEYRKKLEDAKKRESALENDLANMWVLVAQLKRDGNVTSEQKNIGQNQVRENVSDPKVGDNKDPMLKDNQAPDNSAPLSNISNEEPLVARLKVVTCLMHARQ